MLGSFLVERRRWCREAAAGEEQSRREGETRGSLPASNRKTGLSGLIYPAGGGAADRAGWGRRLLLVVKANRSMLSFSAGTGWLAGWQGLAGTGWDWLAAGR